MILEVESWLCITLQVVIQVLLKTYCGWHRWKQKARIIEYFIFLLYFAVYKALWYNFPHHNKSCEMTTVILLYRFWQPKLWEIKWKIWSPTARSAEVLSPLHKMASFSSLLCISQQLDLRIKCQKKWKYWVWFIKKWYCASLVLSILYIISHLILQFCEVYSITLILLIWTQRGQVTSLGPQLSRGGARVWTQICGWIENWRGAKLKLYMLVFLWMW